MSLKCGFCRQNKAIFRAYDARKYLCGDCLDQKILRNVKRTIKEFRMFSEKDKVMVALSGGKDSLGLAHILKRLGYDIAGMTIVLGITGRSSKKVENIFPYSSLSHQKTEKFCQENQIPLFSVSLEDEFEKTIDDLAGRFRKACSACGTVKRYLMNQLPAEKGYNVLATGHNLDDEVVTLFANNLRWDMGYLKRQYPVLEESSGFVKKVKPLVYVYEREMAMYCLIHKIDYIREECPYSIGATSIEWKELWDEMERKRPGLKKQYLTLFYKNFAELQKDQKETIALEPCRVCGQMTANPQRICQFCRLMRAEELKGWMTEV